MLRFGSPAPIFEFQVKLNWLINEGKSKGMGISVKLIKPLLLLIVEELIKFDYQSLIIIPIVAVISPFIKKGVSEQCNNLAYSYSFYHLEENFRTKIKHKHHFSLKPIISFKFNIFEFWNNSFFLKVINLFTEFNF